jgi:hypothetical protein
MPSHFAFAFSFVEAPAAAAVVEEKQLDRHGNVITGSVYDQAWGASCPRPQYKFDPKPHVTKVMALVAVDVTKSHELIRYTANSIGRIRRMQKRTFRWRSNRCVTINRTSCAATMRDT